MLGNFAHISRSLAFVTLFVACSNDARPAAGSLHMIQATGRLGEKDDDLGAVLIGQAVCGSHIFVRVEGGTHSWAGGTRRSASCLRLPGTGDLRDFELSIYPAHTASNVHAQLLLDPYYCGSASPSCEAVCAGVEVSEKPTNLAAGDPCPGEWGLLDQATLLVSNVLGTSDASSGSGSGSGSTGEATSTSTSTSTGTGTTAGPGASSGTTGDDSSTGPNTTSTT